MSLLPILHFPDPVLLTVGRPVGKDEFDPDLRTFVEDMFETMEKAGGVGIQQRHPKHVQVSASRRRKLASQKGSLLWMFQGMRGKYSVMC